jgi:glycosyltransferase involved in cell wall biosynthesis
VKKNVTYIISDIDKAIAFEWIVERLNAEKITLSFILINSESSYLYQYLKDVNIPTYLISCRSKKNIPLAIFQCCKLLFKIKPNVVHCHLFIANIIGLTSAKIMGVKSRIFTRHHSDYHHIYYQNTVKWDKYCNTLSTKIISISDNVSTILIAKENVPENKIIKIPHGFDIKKFINPNAEQVNALQVKYNLNKKKPVIGVISRFIDWKGIQYIIPAYKEILKKHPNSLLLLFNAAGSYEKEINNLLKELPQDSFQKIKFENDIVNLYKIFNIFIHVPISSTVEAFGQTYIECMLSGIPLIATKSGIGNEIMSNGFNCIEVPYKNVNAIYNALINIIENKELSDTITQNAKQTVTENFSIDKMILSLEAVYLQ